MIEHLINQYIVSLEKDGRFTAEQEPKTESPSVVVWCLYYKAHHLDYLRQYPEALTVVDKLIKHTPTNIDAYVLKARILKHSGDMVTAHDYMDQARRMDTVSTRHALLVRTLVTLWHFDVFLSVHIRAVLVLDSIFVVYCGYGLPKGFIQSTCFS